MKHIESLIFNKNDNVAIVTTTHNNVKVGKIYNIHEDKWIMVKGHIPWGHKVALKAIRNAEHIIKYGQIIGVSTKDIAAGEHVHNMNMKFIGNISFRKNDAEKDLDCLTAEMPREFTGYLRGDGQAGTRNYIAVVSPVNCSATVAKRIAEHFRQEKHIGKSIDGIIPVTYGGGCAQSKATYAYTTLNKALAGWVDHPNVVGVLVVGLGCESTCYDSFMKYVKCNGKSHKRPILHFNIQDVGGTTKAIEYGIRKVEELICALPDCKRQLLPVSHLKLALNCGGSDVFSSVTANPALGGASDMLVALGGTSVLGELPECHGAEKHLIDRCKHKKDKEKLKQIIHWWKTYLKNNHVTMDDNLASGNIRGGITTILEKSIGAVSKAGVSKISQVLDYAEQMKVPGLLFMNTPGFDPVSVTGLVAGGCNIVAFTTGRGSTYGCAIAPTIKISTTSELYQRMPADIDIDAGSILTGRGISELSRDIYKMIVDVAGGKRTASEKNGIGWEEFVPWQMGEVL